LGISTVTSKDTASNDIVGYSFGRDKTWS
jgi:hypothetical protein